MKIRNLLLFVLTAFIPLIIFRDFTPNNELRYLNIANEAIANGNVFSFYDHGAPYADKPPLYLWIVMLGKLIFGKHIMWFLALFSLIPAFIIAIIMNKWVASVITEEDKKVVTLMMFTSAFYLGSAVVLRMDMLMAMFITLSLYVFYKTYTLQQELQQHPKNELNANETKIKNKLNNLRFLFPIYVFLAVFSKGAVGILTPIVSILVFLAFEKKGANQYFNNVKYYLGWRMWSVLFSLCGLWFWGVWLDGGKEYLNNLLFHQTINRAVDSFHHKEPIWYYGITYWYAIAPWSILVFTAIVTAAIKKIKHSNLEKFLACVTFSFLIMMSLVSSKIVIYLLPVFPFLIYYAYLRLKKIEHNFFIKIGVIIPAIILILPFVGVITACIVGIDNISGLKDAIPAANDTITGELIILLIATAITAASSFVALLRVKKDVPTAVKLTSGSFLTLIFGISLLLPTFNHLLGLEAASKKGYELADKNPEHLYYYNFRAGSSIDAYIKQIMHDDGKYSKKTIDDYTIGEITKEWLEDYNNNKDLKKNNSFKRVIFVKDRHLTRDSLLIKGFTGCEVHKYGEYSIVEVP